MESARGPEPERLKPPLGLRQALSRLAELAEQGFNRGTPPEGRAEPAAAVSAQADSVTL